MGYWLRVEFGLSSPWVAMQQQLVVLPREEMKEVDSQHQRTVVIKMEYSGVVLGAVIQLGWMFGLVESPFARCFESYATQPGIEPGVLLEEYR